MASGKTDQEPRDPEEVLAQQWHDLRHQVMEAIQREYRVCKFTPDEVGERIGRGPSTVSAMIKGQRDLSFQDFHNLARGMGYRLRVTLEKLPL